MKADNDILQLEENIYQQFSKDGAMVTAMGCLFVWLGINMASWSIWADSLLVRMFPRGFEGLIPLCVGAILAYLLIRIWRRRITYPRLGYSKYISSRRVPHSWQIRMVLLFFVLAVAFNFSMTFALRWTSAGHPLPQDQTHFISITASIVGICMAVVGLILGLKRLLMIAVPTLALIWLAAYVQVSQGWVIVMAGLVCIGIGIEHLRHFLKDNPLLESVDVQ